MAQPKKKATDPWLISDADLRRTSPRILNTVQQPPNLAAPQFKFQEAVRPCPIQLRRHSLGGIASLAFATGFSAIGVAALEGVVSTWLVIPAIVGLAAIGLLHVARWVIDNVTPW